MPHFVPASPSTTGLNFTSLPSCPSGYTPYAILVPILGIQSLAPLQIPENYLCPNGCVVCTGGNCCPQSECPSVINVYFPPDVQGNLALLQIEDLTISTDPNGNLYCSNGQQTWNCGNPDQAVQGWVCWDGYGKVVPNPNINWFTFQDLTIFPLPSTTYYLPQTCLYEGRYFTVSRTIDQTSVGGYWTRNSSNVLYWAIQFWYIFSLSLDQVVCEGSGMPITMNYNIGPEAFQYGNVKFTVISPNGQITTITPSTPQGSFTAYKCGQMMITGNNIASSSPINTLFTTLCGSYINIWYTGTTFTSPPPSTSPSPSTIPPSSPSSLPSPLPARPRFSLLDLLLIITGVVALVLFLLGFKKRK